MADIDVSRHGAVQIIRLNRPDKKNAITRAMYAAMTQALADGEGDEEVRVHLFAGVPGAFSAGNDIADFMAAASGGSLGEEVLAFLDTLAGLAKPAVSAVDGLAIGIGTTIHLHCDLTLATPASVFKTPFVDLGLVPEAASSLLGPAVMGHQRAYALLAMGQSLSAAAARDAGLIWRVVEEGSVEDAALEVATTLAEKPPEALAIAKRLMKPDGAAVRQRMTEEAALFGERLRSDEARAAFMAFMSKGKA